MPYSAVGREYIRARSDLTVLQGGEYCKIVSQKSIRTLSRKNSGHASAVGGNAGFQSWHDPALLCRIWHLAWPLMLANASAPLLGLVDTGLMGHQADSRYLAAVALGANLFSVVAWGFNLLTMATSGSTAWIFGASGLVAAGRWLRRLAFWVAALGVLLVLASPLLIELGLRFYNPPEAIVSGVRDYLGIRLWSAPFVLLNLLLAGWFIGIQYTRVNLLATLTAQIVNILLSVLLVLGLGWQIEGVALGSVAGDICAFAVYTGFAIRRLGRARTTAEPTDFSTVIPSLFHYLQLAFPLLIRTFTLLFAFNWFSRLGLQLGQDTVAANAVLLSFLLVISSILDGYANAAEALVGENAGAGRKRAVQAAILASGLWSLTTALALVSLFALSHGFWIELLTDLPEIRDLAGQYAIWLILMPLYTWWAYWLDGVYIGLQWVRDMRNVLLLSVFAFYWPLSLIIPVTSNHVIWALFAGMMALRSLLMGALVWRRWHRIAAGRNPIT